MTIKSKPVTAEYRDGYDRIFKPKAPVSVTISAADVPANASAKGLEELVLARLSAAGADTSTGTLSYFDDLNGMLRIFTWTPSK